MNKKEFIQACHYGGYCTKPVAEKYAKDKDVFGVDDFAEAYRLQERKNQAARGDERMRDYCGVKCTKRLKYPEV